jgi:GTP-binding protein
LDLQLHEWLEHGARPRLIVATKSDKLSNNELKESFRRVKRVFSEDRVVAFSAKTGRGGTEVWRAIEDALAGFNHPQSP